MINNHKTSALMQRWMRRGWWAWTLSPVSLVFGLALILRAQFYRFGWLAQSRLPVPVIVVGNIFVGGTGKTPLSIWLLRNLQQRGRRPGVISRGYGGNNPAPVVVLPDSNPGDVGDEPVLIAQSVGCPVVVGRNRVEAGLALLREFPQTDMIISDDGLQHYALARDLEIMLFDGRGVGNGWLLPAGPLREPVGRQRDFTVVNLNPHEDLPIGIPINAFRMTLTGSTAARLMHPEQTRQLRDLDDQLRIVAAAGIGNPARFFAMLRGQGVQFVEMPLPDHFGFETNPFANLSADLILVTEKDAVKCRQRDDIASDARIWVVGVDAMIDTALLDAILTKQNEIEKRRTT